MPRSLFDISKKVFIIVLIMHLVVIDGKSLLCHVTGLLYYSTWFGIGQEIFQHKLKYFGNFCCLAFVVWVARRINRHGRPKQDSKTWRHVSIKQPIASQDRSVVIDAFVSYEVVTDLRPVVTQGSDKDFLRLANKTPTADACSAEERARVPGKARTVDGDVQAEKAVAKVDSHVLKPVGSEVSTSSSVVQSALDEQIDCQMGSCVDVMDDDSQFVAAFPVGLTRTRILVAAGVVGVGGFLCWRLLKK